MAVRSSDNLPIPIQVPDGLHLHVDHGLHTYIDHAPLQRSTQDHEHPEHIATSPSPASSIQYEKNRLHELDQPQTRPKGSLWKKYTLAVFLCVLVLLAVILGAFFGTRAARGSSNNPDSSKTPPIASVQAPNRVRSLYGAFNGTGIAAFTTAAPAYWGLVIYQDYSGALKEVHWTYNINNDTIGLLDTRTAPGITAANSTSLAGATYNVNNEVFYYHVIYVNQQGVLSDAWRSRDAIDAPWRPGNLSALNFRSAPTAQGRPALGMEFDGNVKPTSARPNATRVFAGGADGRVHQLAMSWSDWTWIGLGTNGTANTGSDITLPGSYAWGAAASAYGYGGDGTANSTIYTSLADGSLQLHFSIDGNPKDSRAMWPQGQWTDPLNSTTRIAPNSSAYAHWNTWCPPVVNSSAHTCDSYLLYPNSDGRLVRQHLDSATNSPAQLGNIDADFTKQPIMPGTDLAGTNGNSTQVLFHQTNGTDIAWLVMYDNGTITGTGQLNIPQS